LYLHNDPVRIIAGAHKGASGSLVTVISLKPEPRFVVELEAGRDVEVAQSEIERVDA
jgi:ribosomal protein L24